MAWIVGIREVRQIDVLVQDRERRGVEGRIPGVMRPRRVVVHLSNSAIIETVSRVAVSLPQSSGAGPCGTLARWSTPQWPLMPVLSPIEWSAQHLLEPMRRYYASYDPPKCVRGPVHGKQRGRARAA